MRQKMASQLDELIGTEKALSVAVKSASSRVADEAISTRLRDIGERHERQADELEQVHVQAAEGDMTTERAVIREIEHARGVDGLMAALSHVEQDQAERYREVIDGTDDDRVREMLRQQLEAFDEDQRVFLDQSVGLGEIADPRRLP